MPEGQSHRGPAKKPETDINDILTTNTILTYFATS